MQLCIIEMSYRSNFIINCDIPSVDFRHDLADFGSFPVSTGVEGVAYVGTVCNTNDEEVFQFLSGKYNHKLL